jgi:hypothetical protein
MGVDFYNCDICNEIYADCVGGSCEGCHASWCDRCDAKTSIFNFEDEIRCDLCFSTDPVKITDELVLTYVLASLGKTKADVVAEMRKLPKYIKPQNEYYCTFANDKDDEAHEEVCGNNECDRVMDDVHDKELERYVTANRRGWCCVAQGSKDLCHACKNKKIKLED